MSPDEKVPALDDTATPSALPRPLQAMPTEAIAIPVHTDFDGLAPFADPEALDPAPKAPVAVSAGVTPSSALPGAPEPGKQFHGLRVHSVLGAGGMGAAYLASHPVLRMPLVIKTFRAGTPVQLFREAHLAARVSSPHVVAVLDAGVEGEVPFVVQRYVDGIDLEELLRAAQSIGRRLPIDLVCRLVLDVARGLHAIHQAGVVHRDVKPANLFLSGGGVASVGDFGIAIESRERASVEALTGTPQFMAPEQWNQSGVDRRTDVYALGGTAHLLCTSRPPFAGQSALQLGVQHVTEPYLSPAPSEPREAYLFAVIDRMLRKRPEERYLSADAVVRALEVVTEPGAQWRVRGEDLATVGPITVELARGDIAAQEADVIVNAANSLLLMDVGVAAALVRAGGDVIEEEAAPHAPVAMGDVVWTGAGALKARYVAHAVAALDGAICLQRTALRVLFEAEARGCATVAFPALGTGVGEVPMALGAKLLLEAFRTFAWINPARVHTLRVVLYDPAAHEAWRDALQTL